MLAENGTHHNSPGVLGVGRDGEAFYLVVVGPQCCGRHERRTSERQAASRDAAMRTLDQAVIAGYLPQAEITCALTRGDGQRWSVSFDRPFWPTERDAEPATFESVYGAHERGI